MPGASASVCRTWALIPQRPAFAAQRREPRCGRNIEVPGDYPYLVGEYAEWFVKGFEASACCKHYAATSMEHTTEGGARHARHEFSPNITQQDLVDYYLLPFQSCVEKGEVSGLMCSFGMSLIMCSVLIGHTQVWHSHSHKDRGVSSLDH